MPLRLSGKFVFGILASLVLAAGAAQLGLRALGFADMSPYRVDPVLGYALLEGASGTFAGDKRWALNARGMRMDEPCRPGPASVLLIGDSIVHGGVNIGQEETLGTYLVEATERQACPLAAGSWALENELRAIIGNPDFPTFGSIVLVVNADADTRLPAGTVARLAEMIAHGLSDEPASVPER